MNLKWWCKDYKDLTKDERQVVGSVLPHTKYIFCRNGRNWFALPLSYDMEYGLDAEVFKKIVDEIRKQHILNNPLR